MTKQEFIEGIERARNNERLLSHYVGLCWAIGDSFYYPANDLIRGHFQELFYNGHIYYWGIPT